MDAHTDVRPGTAAQRRRFYAALGLFLAWVAALGVLAAVSGRRPDPRPAAAIERR
jgi:hypothetical protein